MQTASNFILSLAGPSRANDADDNDSDNGAAPMTSSTVDHIKSSEDGTMLTDFANRYPFIKQENFTIELSDEEETR